eukprot:gene10175-13690_t
MSRLSSIRVSTANESGQRVSPELFKHRVLQIAEETIDSLQVIWREAGYEDIECQGLLGDLLQKLKQHCASELASEQLILEHAKQEVALRIQEYQSQCKKLGRIDESNGIESSLLSMNYADKLAELEKLNLSITNEVNQRLKIITTEYNALKDLCDSLGESAPSLESFNSNGDSELSDARLNSIKAARKSFDTIKQKRFEDMKRIINECKQHIVDLVLDEEGHETMEDYKSFIECDKNIYRFLQNNEFTFGVHINDFNQLTARLKSFIAEKDYRRDELAKTGAEIARLWSLLRIPSSEREAFQSSFQMNLSIETLTKGYDELKRLRDIRTKSLGNVITSIRNDIVTLWEEAGIESQDQRFQEFPGYFDSIENLLDSSVDQHESYYNQLKARVEELKPILQKISRRETVVQERIELEHIQLNPERLTARGPNAREERKREEYMTNRVKNLEKLTKELIAQIQAWEEQNGHFFYMGERYFDRIVNQEEAYVEIRDSLRNARKKKTNESGNNNNNSNYNTTSAGKQVDNFPLNPKQTVHSTTSSAKKSYATPKANREGVLLSDIHLAMTSQNHPASAYKQFLQTQTNSMNISNMENVYHNDRNSNGSDGTQCTSATEIKDRPSSATVIRTMNI